MVLSKYSVGLLLRWAPQGQFRKFGRNFRGGSCHCKCIADPSHVLSEQPITLREDLAYEEEAVQILDRREQHLWNKVIPLVKVLWRNHLVEEATWEAEFQMRQQYPIFSCDRYANFEDKISLRRGEL